MKSLRLVVGFLIVAFVLLLFTTATSTSNVRATASTSSVVVVQGEVDNPVDGNSESPNLIIKEVAVNRNIGNSKNTPNKVKGTLPSLGEEEKQFFLLGFGVLGFVALGVFILAKSLEEDRRY